MQFSGVTDEAFCRSNHTLVRLLPLLLTVPLIHLSSASIYSGLLLSPVIESISFELYDQLKKPLF